MLMDLITDFTSEIDRVNGTTRGMKPLCLRCLAFSETNIECIFSLTNFRQISIIFVEGGTLWTSLVYR